MLLSFKKRLGIAGIFILAALPFVIWLSIAPLGSRLGGWPLILTSLGQLCGLTGLTLFLLNIIISARLRFLEPYFRGLNNIYLDHHRIGVIAFVLLLFHPLALALRYLPLSLTQAAFSLLPDWQNKATLYGLTALSLFIVLMVLTLHLRPAYHIWKFSHKFLAGVYFFALLHLLLIPSDTSRSPILKNYLLILSALAILAIIYRVLFSGFLVKKWKYKITKIVQLNSQITEISLEPVIKAMSYRPGQFVFISLNDSAVSREVHPFSIISSPNQSGLQLAIKNLGDYTEKIKNLTVGSEAYIEGPFGEFSYLSTFNKKQIWVAGGIGLTPFLGMARDFNFKKENYRVDLYNCVHDEKELIYSEELRAIASQNKNFRVINYCSAGQGRVTADYLNNITPDLLKRDIFICGPVLMMKNLRQQLIGLGLRKGQIRTEEFEL